MAEVGFVSASAAYARALGNMAGEAKSATTAPEKSSGESFGDMVGRALDAARTSAAKAEHNAAAGIAGEIGLHDVVTSVTNAEVTLQTVVALRDRVIGAYNDILRMPI